MALRKRSWLAVAFSDEIPPGGVEPLVVAGRGYVLFRSEEGQPRVLDAHCRHLGAHLGYGGRVEGGALRCPFHGWRWEADGRCSDVPYARRIPPGARIGAWSAADRNGVVIAWLAQGEPGPTPPELPTGAGSWARASRWRVRHSGAPESVAARLLGHAQLCAALGAAPDPDAVERAPGLAESRAALPEGALTSWRLCDTTWLHRFEGVLEASLACHATPLDATRTDVRAGLCAPAGARADALRETVSALLDAGAA